jgi:hypothetical protein
MTVLIKKIQPPPSGAAGLFVIFSDNRLLQQNHTAQTHPVRVDETGHVDPAGHLAAAVVTALPDAGVLASRKLAILQGPHQFPVHVLDPDFRPSRPFQGEIDAGLGVEGVRVIVDAGHQRRRVRDIGQGRIEEAQPVVGR